MNQHWTANPIPSADHAAADQARERQDRLTKPPGSLGQLEDIAITLAKVANGREPAVDPVSITVFAADHGIAATDLGARVSAYPAEVTLQMLHNFASGGAAINVLARLLDATLEVVDVGTASDPGPMDGVLQHRAGNGTADLRDTDAMTPEQLEIALQAGQQAAERAHERAARLFIGGEMGIGNSTSAAALAAALLSASAAALVGPGTGLDPAGVARKTTAVETALNRYRQQPLQLPMLALQALGGFEIAALTGAYIRCAQLKLPVLVDGFIAGAAALAAIRLNPSVSSWLLYSHCSAEPGHEIILRTLNAKPVLDLGMRLGEGSGAAASVPMLRVAATLHNCMATFDEAGVSSQ